MSASVPYAGSKTAYLHLLFPGSPIDELGLEQVLLLRAIAASVMNCWWILLPKSSKSAVWVFVNIIPIPVGTGDSPQLFVINQFHVSVIFAKTFSGITVCV